MKLDVKEALKEFLDDRKDRFPKITEKQKKEWVKNIEGYLSYSLGDSDVFYDFKPDDVKEAE